MKRAFQRCMGWVGEGAYFFFENWCVLSAVWDPLSRVHGVLAHCFEVRYSVGRSSGAWCPGGPGMVFLFGKVLKGAFGRCMGWEGGVGITFFIEILVATITAVCPYSAALPCLVMLLDGVRKSHCHVFLGVLDPSQAI